MQFLGKNFGTGAAVGRVLSPRPRYEFIANDIVKKPAPTNYLKWRLPLRYAARTDEVSFCGQEEAAGDRAVAEGTRRREDFSRCCGGHLWRRTLFEEPAPKHCLGAGSSASIRRFVVTRKLS